MAFLIFSMIRTCLSWWVRDPMMYLYWRHEGQLLPHPDTLRKHKNCLEQKPGFIPDMFTWMKQEGDRLGLQDHQRVGAIIIDEMSIQEDLSLLHKGFQTHYRGQVAITPHCQAVIKERKGKFVANTLSASFQ